MALAGYQKVVSVDDRNVLALRDLGRCYRSQGTALVALGKTNQGIESIRKAVGISEALSSKDPSDTYYKLPDLANTYFSLAEAYSHLAAQLSTPDTARIASWEEARSWYEKSLATWLRAKHKGPLGRFDAAEPDKIAHEIAQCDIALAKLRSSSSLPPTSVSRR